MGKKKKKKSKKNKPFMEFSKKISIAIISIFAVVIVYSMALMWKTGTTDGLSYLIPSVTGLAVTATGFYFHKAQMENVIKLGKEHGLTTDEMKSVAETVKEISE